MLNAANNVNHNDYINASHVKVSTLFTHVASRTLILEWNCNYLAVYKKCRNNN